jgi:hypothetical protein
VKFEDGRTGVVSADVRIEDARTFSPEQLSKAS